MSQTGLAAFDSTIQTTNEWLNAVQDRLLWSSHRLAYHALRAVLHALRDRLTVEQAASFAAQLPLLIRGLFYEGWNPHGKPVKEHHRDQFVAQVAAAFGEDETIDPETVTEAVLRVVAGHVTSGEVEKIKQGLPAELRTLWPREATCCKPDTVAACGGSAS
jgi:uncharacterized protein (DUF2267 family)